jgi:hypothetical protein
MMNNIVYTTKPEPNSLPGFWEPKVIPAIENCINKKEIPGMPMEDAFILENVLSAEDCSILIDFMKSSENFEEVGVQGMKDCKDTNIGSMRTSIWTPGTAEILWNKIAHQLCTLSGNQHVATDWWQHLSQDELYNPMVTYSPVALSPLMRFMKYENGGQHYAHYDAGFIYPDHSYRTLKSMVIYLTTNQGAATRFVRDKQDAIAVWNRNHHDWSRPVNPDEVIAKSECIAGNVLIFNHRLCHDVEHYFGTEPRIIIRGDVVYKRL